MSALIRITPRLSDVTSGKVAASHKLDGALSEIFVLQDRIVAQFLESLKISLTASARAEIAKPATRSRSAYELFARARQLQNRFTPTAMIESIALLEAATASDAEFALGHSGLGYAYAFGFIGSSDPADLVKALIHLDRAVALEPDFSRAHFFLALALLTGNVASDELWRRRARAVRALFNAARTEPGSQAHRALGDLARQRWNLTKR